MVYAIGPHAGMMWRLAAYEASQRRRTLWATPLASPGWPTSAADQKAYTRVADGDDFRRAPGVQNGYLHAGPLTNAGYSARPGAWPDAAPPAESKRMGALPEARVS